MNPTFTLGQIRAARPCAEGWTKLLTSFGCANGDYDPGTRLSLGDVAASNGVADAMWCVQCLEWSDVAVRRAVVTAVVLPAARRAAVHYPDNRVTACLDAVAAWCAGNNTVDLSAARIAAEEAAVAVAARAAAYVATAAAANAAAEAAEAAVWATEAALTAAYVATVSAAAAADAYAAERAAQCAAILAAFPPVARAAGHRVRTVSFDISVGDSRALHDVTERAAALGLVDGVRGRTLAHMDLVLVHANGCPLDFIAWRGANTAAFAHAFLVLLAHTDHETGKLASGFAPYFSRSGAV